MIKGDVTIKWRKVFEIVRRPEYNDAGAPRNSVTTWLQPRTGTAMNVISRISDERVDAVKYDENASSII
ncbi:hypothetical protein P692DRAFT_20830245 [Suillus brevipes Sb2]|nr:hypothetical protein P692DRAFT_20830245 [Suillus brevipes Sb2]